MEQAPAHAQRLPLPAPPANAIPILNTPPMTLNFGKMDSDYTTVDHTLQIENQDTLSGETYATLQAICSIDLNLDQATFIKIWKTLLLKRCQDVYEMEKGVQAPNRLQINRGIIVPAPLADVLASLGEFSSNITGHIHHIVPPAKPAAHPADFWLTTRAELRQWAILMGRLQHHYVMKEFPPMESIDKRALVLTRKRVANALTKVRALTSEPTSNDALVRLVNDDLFVDHTIYSFDDASLDMTPNIDADTILGTYVSGYILASTA